MNKKLLVLLFTVLLAVLFLGACSEDDSTSPDGTDTSVPPTSWDTDYDTLSDGDTLKGEYEGSVEIPADATVYLEGTVTFKWGTILKINEGVTIKGKTNVLSYLIIDRGAKIEAVGTASKPIVFTSGKAVGSRSQQDWGGVIVNGYATINEGNGTAYGEGDSGLYGGTKDDDNSGTIKYVRVEFAGKNFSTEDELNGLCLQGVGSETTVEYVHLHNNKDDGIEMFGGTVNIKYIVATCNGDDQIDATYGWRGKGQFLVAAPLGGDRGFEHDNNGDNNIAEPLGEVNYYNITVVRGDDAEKTGMRIRRGKQAHIYNAYVAGFTNGIGIKTTEADTSCDVQNTVFENCSTNSTVQSAGTLTVEDSTVTVTEGSWSYLSKADFASKTALASAGSAAFQPDTINTTDAATPPDDGFFDASAAFIGAVGSTDWMNGWTEFPEN